MDIYLGFECSTNPMWSDLAPEIKAPSNYKKPEVINDYIARKTIELEYQAPTKVLLGHVDAVSSFVSDDKGGMKPFCTSTDPAEVYNKISSAIGGSKVTLYGLDIKQRIHQLAVQLPPNIRDKAWGLHAMTLGYKIVDRLNIVDPLKLVLGDTFGTSSGDRVRVITRRFAHIGLPLDKTNKTFNPEIWESPCAEQDAAVAFAVVQHYGVNDAIL